MSLKILLAVAAGGAAGALGRYGMMVLVGRIAGLGFPWGTLAVNILGSFLLGALVELMALAWSPDEAVRAFLAVGVLGAFTTFSTFSMDVVLLAQRGEMAAAALYVAASVGLSVAAFICGLWVMRPLLS